MHREPSVFCLILYTIPLLPCFAKGKNGGRGANCGTSCQTSQMKVWFTAIVDPLFRLRKRSQGNYFTWAAGGRMADSETCRLCLASCTIAKAAHGRKRLPSCRDPRFVGFDHKIRLGWANLLPHLSAENQRT